MKPLLTKPFVTLTLSMFFLSTGFYFLLPTMPLYIKELGGNESQVGLVIGLFTIAAVIIRPFVGSLLDQIGRKSFIMWGLSLFAITMYSYTWASSILLLLVFRVIHGISWAFATTAIATAITDTIPEQRRGEGMGWFGLSGTLAMAIGPLLGVWLVAEQSFTGTFLVATLLVLISLVGSSMVNMPFQKSSYTGRMRLFDKSLLPITFIVFFLAFVYGGIVTFIPLFSTSVQVNPGLFFLVYAIALTLVRFFSGRFADRYGEAYVIIPGLLVTIAAMITLASTAGLTGVVAGAILFGFGFGSAHPVLQAVALRLVRPDQKGMANASFTTAFDLGLGIGSITLGWISEWSGYSALFLVAAIFGAVSLAIYLLTAKQMNQKQETAQEA